MIVFPNQRISSELSASIPNHWGIGRSKSGWMTAETFFEFITNVFNPWLGLPENEIEKPVVLYLDGHKSHLSLHLSNFCSTNGIILIALYPNTTHMCQPLDVSVFKPLKTKWRSVVREWCSENLGEKVKKTDFCSLLQRAINQLGDDTLTNGFRHCGLYPFTSAVIPQLFERERQKSTKESTDSIEMCQKRNALSCIQNLMGEMKLRDFRNGVHSHEDAGLYQMWQQLQRSRGR